MIAGLYIHIRTRTSVSVRLTLQHTMFQTIVIIDCWVILITTRTSRRMHNTSYTQVTLLIDCWSKFKTTCTSANVCLALDYALLRSVRPHADGFLFIAALIGECLLSITIFSTSPCHSVRAYSTLPCSLFGHPSRGGQMSRASASGSGRSGNLKVVV